MSVMMYAIGFKVEQIGHRLFEKVEEVVEIREDPKRLARILRVATLRRAIYKDGWWACARLDKIPWDFTPETMKRFAPGAYDPDQDVWGLYFRAFQRRRPWSSLSPGEEVAKNRGRKAAWPTGANAEYHLVDERIVGRKPRSLAFRAGNDLSGCLCQKSKSCSERSR